MQNVSTSVRKDNLLQRNVADLQKRVAFLEDLIISAKETLTLEEAAAFLGMKRSTLYKMTHEQTIPFYKPNGKLVYFEKTDLLDWIRRNRVSSDAEITEAARIHMKILSQRK